MRTRRAILEAAAVVFEERGYGAAKLTDIVTLAHVTKGALYFHFDSKEDLAQAVIDAQVSMHAPFTRRSSRHRSSSTSAWSSRTASGTTC
ncbi:TetR family transcriptional regulator [Streptomyces sp. MS1.HAVA.3]|uniref:TetR family transcriptional regulator n=1 Tax=Streptomyces caledonius TaxID=3134107 RepID=A0ABU8U5W5_9ACTN